MQPWYFLIRTTVRILGPDSSNPALTYLSADSSRWLLFFSVHAPKSLARLLTRELLSNRSLSLASLVTARPTYYSPHM